MGCFKKKKMNWALRGTGWGIGLRWAGLGPGSVQREPNRFDGIYIGSESIFLSFVKFISLSSLLPTALSL